MLGKVLGIVIILSAVTQVNAEVRLFLYPKIEKKEKITVGDIAKIEASPSEQRSLAAFEIDETVYADGFIDRRELFTLLQQYSSDGLFIYGHATRVLSETTIDQDQARFVVNRGQNIKVIVTYRGITIETSGRAMENGANGDIIAVELSKKKIIRCKIVNNGIVAKSL